MKIERGSKNFLTVALVYWDIPSKDSLGFQPSRLVKILTLIIIFVERSKFKGAMGKGHFDVSKSNLWFAGHMTDPGRSLNSVREILPLQPQRHIH